MMTRVPHWMLSVVALILPSFVFGRYLNPEIKEAMEHGAEAKICLKVCDHGGVPVSNASVKAEFDLMSAEPCSTYGKTDANGRLTVIGKTNGNKIRFWIGKDGYYGSLKEVTYIQMGKERDVKNGRWIPYGDDMLIILRPMINPVRLKSTPVRDYKLTDAICEWVGYDLEKNDFVKPFGGGDVSDFEVYLDWDRVYSIADCRQIGFKIRFVEPKSGYYSMKIMPDSEFTTPYNAQPHATFLKNAEFYDRQGGRRIKNTFDRSKCWVIRSRCKVDSQGHLTSSHYSVAKFLGISGSSEAKAGFCFLGAFNTTPNDTNLEDVEMANRVHNFVRQCEPPPKSNETRHK